MRTVAAPLDEMVFGLRTLGKIPRKNPFSEDGHVIATTGPEAR